jgi:hypothetical protein
VLVTHNVQIRRAAPGDREMKIKVFSVALICLLCAACGDIYTHELTKIIEECGGAEKVHRMWVDVTTTKAYCLNGDRAGKW